MQLVIVQWLCQLADEKPMLLSQFYEIANREIERVLQVL